MPLAERPLRRLPQLLFGLALYGFSLALLVRASLGVNPWSVLYDGLAKQTPLSFGAISAVVGVLALLGWIPLRQRPTFGTFANIAVLALSSDLGLLVLPPCRGLAARSALLAAGIAVNALAIAVYVGARLGPGPRDGLMTGAAAVTGRSIRSVRTLIELTVLTAGWLLGGRAGVGTVLYALAVGPAAQLLLPRFAYRGAAEPAGPAAPDCPPGAAGGGRPGSGAVEVGQVGAVGAGREVAGPGA
ncbi:YczE/YyaS/YitT family protein [Kitasatospora indigofera]|uniref:membrane protein YczE n=1 Tax=Kitasatospora indigofera TaxID=67307 RepID=UPI003F4B3975